MERRPDNSEGTDGTASGQPPEAAAAGADTPRLVIRGESYQAIDPHTGEKCIIVPVDRKGRVKLIPLPADGANPYAAITDWLNLTFPITESEDLGPRFRRLFEVVGNELAPAEARPWGKYNYTRSFALGSTKGLFCHGGNAGTALVSLPGEVCALVDDWAALVALGRDEWKGRITRWDGAVDDYLGAHSVEEALALFEKGGFGVGGREPQMRQYGNWAKPDGRGRSIEIGARDNGKRLMVYEKGMQLGFPFHPWCRWELSYGNRGRIVPWEVLLEPGRYVAGAYPKALSWVQDEMSRVLTLQRQTQIGYDASVKAARNQVGALLNLMVEVEGSAENAVAKLIRPGMPRRVRHPAVKNPEGWIE
jgi:phage replication initiation protein